MMTVSLNAARGSIVELSKKINRHPDIHSHDDEEDDNSAGREEPMNVSDPYRARPGGDEIRERSRCIDTYTRNQN